METKLLINTPLNISEIDFRVQSINRGGYATILAYKDARVDMNRLDAVYGSEFWQKKYETRNGHLFCSVGVWNRELKEWVWKEDVGTESNTEKTKGEASDAFKRACFNLGIGRELYDYPVISVKLLANEFELKDTQQGKKAYATFDLKLKEWVWTSEFTDGKLVFLQAIDNNGKMRFTYKAGQEQPKAPTLEEQIDTAIEEMTKVVSIDELKNIWSKYKALQTNEKFIASKDKRKKELTSKDAA